MISLALDILLHIIKSDNRNVIVLSVNLVCALFFSSHTHLKHSVETKLRSIRTFRRRSHLFLMFKISIRRLSHASKSLFEFVFTFLIHCLFRVQILFNTEWYTNCRLHNCEIFSLQRCPCGGTKYCLHTDPL